MRYVVVDLEWNPIAKEQKEIRQICKNEIIQFGAVVLDEKYQEIGNFSSLVKPEYNKKIERKIEKLTGIKTEQVESAPVFHDALHMFLQWCLNYPGQLQILQWSKNDLLQIQKEMQLKQYMPDAEEERLLVDWQDFQEEYDAKLGVDRNLSLSAAVMYAGLDFQGSAHDALWDARNTGDLLRILRDEVSCKKALGSVIEAFQPKPIGTTLGDLFNFSAFAIE